MVGRKIDIVVDYGVPTPEYAHDGDAGLDLRIREAATLEPGERRIMGTGVSVAIPTGCVGLLFPRSGLASKTGVALSNCVGVIDSGYRGEIKASLVNNGTEAVTLEAGERVCQLVVVPFVPCTLNPVESLGETERGAGGFGSTGRR